MGWKATIERLLHKPIKKYLEEEEGGPRRKPPSREGSDGKG